MEFCHPFCHTNLKRLSAAHCAVAPSPITAWILATARGQTEHPILVPEHINRFILCDCS